MVTTYVLAKGRQRNDGDDDDDDDDKRDIYIDVHLVPHLPLACSTSPAVSSARAASLGKCSSTTDAAMVMGKSAPSRSRTSSSGDVDMDAFLFPGRLIKRV